MPNLTVEESADQIWIGMDTNFPLMAAVTPEGIAIFGGHPFYAMDDEAARRLTMWLADKLGIPF